MAFRMTFRDGQNGTEKLAQVSLFVVRNGQFVALYNIKDEATPQAAHAAREELQNFVELIAGLQEAGQDFLIEVDEGDMRSVSEINLTQTLLVTSGPKGAVAAGFDEELELTEDQLTLLAEELIAQHQAAQPSAGPFTVFDLQ